MFPQPSLERVEFEFRSTFFINNNSFTVHLHSCLYVCVSPCVCASMVAGSVHNTFTSDKSDSQQQNVIYASPSSTAPSQASLKIDAEAKSTQGRNILQPPLVQDGAASLVARQVPQTLTTDESTSQQQRVIHAPPSSTAPSQASLKIDAEAASQVARLEDAEQGTERYVDVGARWRLRYA